MIRVTGWWPILCGKPSSRPKLPAPPDNFINKSKQITMNILNDAENQDKDRSKSKTGEVREGQADSSIRHDSKDEDAELPRKLENDDRALSQQEFIDDDKNTKKASE